jgi:rRNA processing protein Krr1/Pno1
MRQMQEVMGPMMRANMQAMMEATLTVLARKETADQMATFAKNYLDALVAKGFSREEALRLVAAHAPTLVPGVR